MWLALYWAPLQSSGVLLLPRMTGLPYVVLAHPGLTQSVCLLPHSPLPPGICERSQRTELCGQLLKTMCKKFGGSAKVWLRQLEHMLQAGDEEGARKLMDRALASLPRRKHIKVGGEDGGSSYAVQGGHGLLFWFRLSVWVCTELV